MLMSDELHKLLKKNTAQGILISTYEVTIGQQDIRIKKLEAQVKELQGWNFENIIDKIYGEHKPKEQEAYPYTHPIRDIPNYARVKR